MPDLAQIQSDMALFDDWTDKYAYLIDLGRTLPPYPADVRDDAHKVTGCTSQVWLDLNWQDGCLNIQADSDALIVKGLLGVVLAAYQGKTRAEAENIDVPAAFAAMGLAAHLTPNRRNGFTAMVGRIKAFLANQPEHPQF